MKITINDEHKAASKFTAIFQTLKQFTDNILFNLKDDGLYIQCLDDSHCCLFECNIKKEWFAGYEFNPNGGDADKFGLNIALFHRVLNARHESQVLEIVLDSEENPNKVEINFVGSDQGKFDKNFELSMVEVDYDLMEPKDVDTIVDLVMDVKTLTELVNQLMIFDENLTLTFKDEVIDMVSTGSDGSMKVEIKLDDVKEYAIAENSSLTQSYSLKFVLLMCQFNKLANDVSMGFSNSMPMTFKYDLGEDSFVKFHLAPKIE